MGLYLGLLGAAKESQIALANDQGEMIAYMPTGPLTMRVNNRFVFDIRDALNRIAYLVNMTLIELTTQLRGACISMSGVYFESDLAALNLNLEAVGLRGSFPLLITEDVHAFFAANFVSKGAIVTAGTGSNVVFRGRNMLQPLRVDGWGSVIGDAGGGYELGVNCLRVILKAIDGRMERSESLEQRVLEHTGLSRREDLIQWYYNVCDTVRWRSDIADLAIPLAAAAEQDEDHIAKEVIEHGVAGLLESFEVGIQRAGDVLEGFLPDSVPLIFEGGLFENVKRYVEAFQSWLSTHSSLKPPFRPMASEYEPIVGALALAVAGEPYLETSREEHSSLKKSACQMGLRVQNRLFSLLGV